MNKNVKYLALSITTTVVGLGAVAFSLDGNGIIQSLRATEDFTDHQIVLTAADLKNVDTSSYNKSFDLVQSNATLSGFSFSVEGAYAQGKTSCTIGENSHIVDALDQTNDCNATISMLISFTGVFEYDSIILHGKFYWDDSYYEETIEFEEKDITYDYLYVYENGYYEIILDSIEINYYCIINV